MIIMLSFIIPFVLSAIFSVLSIIFFAVAYIKNKKNDPNIYVIIASLFSAFVAMISIFNINVPEPTIYPLDNESKIYSDVLLEINIDGGDFYETYYSLDGSDPKDGSIYESPITISETVTICVRNKFLFWWSDISQKTFELNKEISEQNDSGILLYLAGRKYAANQSYDNAFKYYLEASELGCNIAMEELARYYAEGKGTEKNINESRKWYQLYGLNMETTPGLWITVIDNKHLPQENVLITVFDNEKNIVFESYTDEGGKALIGPLDNGFYFGQRHLL